MHPVIDALNEALAGRYRLERELGMGGMATVYLADDLRHDRKVAVKVLKPELAAVLGAERFVVEIKTTASLQHPHILPLFDSGTASGYLYYVMPYIEGETLRDKLNRETQFAINEGVRIAREVADALDYAHRHGVIHRDIKPENILLHDGRPMVADFGIALAVSAAAGGRMTETGLSLGTPHYMSPEQATAEKEITARADVYSLASVLYEMLTGEPPHMGNSAQQIIMKIIAESAQPATKLRKSVPPHVSAALATALEKLPADRFATAREFADALGNPSFTTASLSHTAGVDARRAPSRAVYALAGACAVLLVAAIWGWSRGADIAPLLRYELNESLAPSTLPGGAEAPVPTPSPDGSFLVFHGPSAQALGSQLYIKRREQHTPVPIPGTTDAGTFAISPDGEWIAFVAAQQLRKVPVGGGPPVTLVPARVADAMGVAWLDDNTIVFVINRPLGPPQLGHVPASGGEATIAWQDDQFAGAVPEPIAGRRSVLFSRCKSLVTCDVWALDLHTGEAREVAPGATWAQYSTTGHVVLAQNGHLSARQFDARSLETRGSPFPLADSIAGTYFPIRLSRSGVLVARIGTTVSSAQNDMVWVTRAGAIVAVDTAWRFRHTVSGNNHGWALSHDGTRLAIGLSTDAGDDVWIKELPHGPSSRLTYDADDDYRPRWSKDGRMISFVSNRGSGGVYARRSDFTGNDSLLHTGVVDEALIAPDESSVLIRVGAAGSVRGGRNVFRARIGDSTRVPLIVTEFDEDAIALSPDAKWLAYQSDETGRKEVFVRSYPDVDGFKRQISNGGGEAPLWSRDGRELFYVGSSRDMISVRVTPNASSTGLITSAPEKLFRVPDELLAVEYAFYTPWDVASDGRFIMARRLRSGAKATARTVVAEHWLQELAAKTKR